MNLKYIETLAISAKEGNNSSKEKLIYEFKPFILNLALKYKIPGYDFNDLKHECYKNLFIALDKYNIEKHRFVAFATISIQNSLKTLLRNSKIRDTKVDFCDYLEDTPDDCNSFEDTFCNKELHLFIKKCINSLSPDEVEFVNFVYFQKQSVMAFSIKNKTTYNHARSKNKIILQKLKEFIKVY